MADLNDEVNAIAAHLNRLNNEFDRYANLTANSSNAIRQASAAERARDAELSRSGQMAAQSLQSLAKSVGSAAGAMYEGQRGAAAFNGVVSQMTTAATQAAQAINLLLPGGAVMKIFRSGLIAAGGGLADLAAQLYGTAGEMAEKQYDAYSKLADSGAAASDGMTGVGESAKKLGLNVLKLDNYLNLIGSNSKELALFGGTVFQGRKRFEELGQSLADERQNMTLLGVNQEQMNESMMQYLKLQTITGRAQKMSSEELTDGTRKFLYEQDALTKLTGANRKEQLAIREQALSEQRFRAKLDAMRASGDAKQIASADQLEKANVMLTLQSAEMGQGFRDIQSGAITSVAANKAFYSSQGEVLKASLDLQNGLINASQATDRIGVATGKFATAMNPSAQLGTFEDSAIKYADAQKLALFAAKTSAQKEEIIRVETDKQLARLKEKEGQPSDPRLQEYAKLIKDQQQIMMTLQDAINHGLDINLVPALKSLGLDASLGVGPNASIATSEKIAANVVKLIKEYIGKDVAATGKPPPTTTSVAKETVRLQADQINAEADKIKANKRLADAKTAELIAEKQLAALGDTGSGADMRAAEQKRNAAQKEQAEAQKAIAEAEANLKKATEELVKIRKNQATAPATPDAKEVPKPAEAKPAATEEKKGQSRLDKDTKDPTKSKVAPVPVTTPDSNKITPAAPLTVDTLSLAEKMSKEQKQAINNVLRTMVLPDRVTKDKAGKDVVVPGVPEGMRPVFDPDNDLERGNDTWKAMVKNLSPAQKKGLVDDINKEVEKILNKKAAEKTSAPATPNDLRMNDAAALQPEQIAVNAKNMPTVADLTINSDVATLNSKGMNVTLDNSADVAKMLTETVMSTKTDVVKNDQSIARTSFENSMSDVKTALSNQKDTNEMLLSAIQELIRIQRNSVDVQQKIYNVTA